MSKLITGIKRLALALCFATPLVSWAETAMNPVTGEVESYTYAYIGDATAWSEITWRDADGVDHTDFVPQVDQVYDSLVIKQPVAITAETIEGWTFNIGLFNGANLTIGTLTKWQGGCSARVGSGSKLTISALGNGTYSGDNNFYVAAKDGITYDCDYAKGGSFNYYFAGDGSVAYKNLTGGNHTIKAADITLSAPAEKKLESKTLVSFSNQPNFTVSALVAIKNADGDKVGEAVLSVLNTTGTPTITTDNAVGTCELVREEGALKLYYVDGDPAALAATQPSVNINFTHDSVNVTSYDEVGAPGYSVSGYYWNNVAGAAGETTTVYGKTATGAKAVIDGMSFVVSDTRGSWRNSSAGNILHGYIDDLNNAVQSPTVEVSGIPEDYANYRVILYFSGDTAGNKFGYVTINGENYWGTEAWGSVNATAFVEDGNYRVSPITSRGDGTLTIVTHCMSGARAGLAAIQIVKVELGANDLVIPVNGATEYTVEAAQTPGTVYLTGVGTLTLAGDYKISASTLDIDAGVVLNVDSSKLDATTFTGAGTVVYDGAVPPTDKGWTDSAWTGTVWIKNMSGITGNNNATTGVQPNSLGNSLSKVKFSGVNGWIEAPVEYNPEIVLENAGYDYALKLTNGNSPATTSGNDNRCTVIKKLSGSGTLGCGGSSYAWPLLKVWDATGFTGSIDTSNADGNGQGKTGLVVVFGAEDTVFADTLYNLYNDKGSDSYPHPHTICVASGTTVTQASTATWTAASGFKVEGTLNANGTLASSATAAVTGSGTVVFTGRKPTPTGTAWWQNTAWTGTVEIKNATIAENISLANYGNTGSKVCMNGTTSYLAAVALSGNHNVKELVIGANGFTQNGSYSSGAVSIVLPCKLTGTGTYSLTADGNATKTVSIGDASEFDGMLYPAGNNCRFVVGETSRDVVAGSVVVGSGKVLKIATANTSYSGGLFVDEGGQANITGFLWTAAGITVDGTLTVSSRKDKIGGGTAITLGDTGILEITESGNVETADSYNLVTGTGSIKLSGDGFYVLNGNYPSAMPLINEKGAALVVPTTGATIGSLSGTKGFRSDWSTTPAEGRYLTIKQAQDTEWSGSINQIAEHRLTGVVVDPGESTTGTLTLTATQTKSSTLTVNGSVNLTGTWVGATTVAGTIGGTGTLTGDLTFSEGSTLKAYATGDADGLVVSGTVTYPEAKVTVDVSAIEPDTDVALLKATDLDAANFELTGAPENATLDVVEGVLTLLVPHVTITVPEVANATVTVAIDEETIGNAAGTYNVAPDSVVTVTYAAAAGYKLTGKTEYTIDTSKQTTFDASETQSDAIVATITSANEEVTEYTDLAVAFASVAAGETLTLVGAEVTVGSDVTVSVSYTLAGDAQGTTVTGAGKIYLTGSAELTLDATLTSVGNQFYFSSKDAKLTFPTAGTPPTVRPYTDGGCQTGTTVNGDGTTTYYQYLFLTLQVGASNVTLAYADTEDPLVMKQVYEGDEIVFTATPAEGYENVVVTANSEALTPVDGKYTVVIGTVNVAIQATATLIPTYTVNVTCTSANVEAEADVQSAKEGDSVVVTVTSVTDGYELDDPVVTYVDSNEQPQTLVEDVDYTISVVSGQPTLTITMPAGNLTVTISASESVIGGPVDVNLDSEAYVVTSTSETITVPNGTTAIRLGGNDDYVLGDGDGIRIDGTTVTLLPAEVVDGETKKAVDVGDDYVKLSVTLHRGLAYGVAKGATLSELEADTPAMTTFDGTNADDILTIAKDPTDAAGFYRVHVSFKGTETSVVD